MTDMTAKGFQSLKYLCMPVYLSFIADCPEFTRSADEFDPAPFALAFTFWLYAEVDCCCVPDCPTAR